MDSRTALGHYAELDVVYKHETDLAVLFDIGGEEKWIPKSVIESAYDPEEDEAAQQIYVQVWFAEQEGLV